MVKYVEIRTTEGGTRHIGRRTLHSRHHLAIGRIPPRQTMTSPKGGPQIPIRIYGQTIRTPDRFVDLYNHPALGDPAGAGG